MKKFIVLGAFGVTIAMAQSAAACPYSGNSYAGNNYGLDFRYTFDEGCKSVIIQYQEDDPDRVALVQKGGKWEANFESGKFIFAKNGKSVMLRARDFTINQRMKRIQ